MLRCRLLLDHKRLLDRIDNISSSLSSTLTLQAFEDLSVICRNSSPETYTSISKHRGFLKLMAQIPIIDRYIDLLSLNHILSVMHYIGLSPRITLKSIEHRIFDLVSKSSAPDCINLASALSRAQFHDGKIWSCLYTRIQPEIKSLDFKSLLELSFAVSHNRFQHPVKFISAAFPVLLESSADMSPAEALKLLQSISLWPASLKGSNALKTGIRRLVRRSCEHAGNFPEVIFALDRLRYTTGILPFDLMASVTNSSNWSTGLDSIHLPRLFNILAKRNKSNDVDLERLLERIVSESNDFETKTLCISARFLGEHFRTKPISQLFFSKMDLKFSSSIGNLPLQLIASYIKGCSECRSGSRQLWNAAALAVVKKLSETDVSISADNLVWLLVAFADSGTNDSQLFEAIESALLQRINCLSQIGFINSIWALSVSRRFHSSAITEILLQHVLIPRNTQDAKLLQMALLDLSFENENLISDCKLKRLIGLCKNSSEESPISLEPLDTLSVAIKATLGVEDFRTDCVFDGHRVDFACGSTAIIVLDDSHIFGLLDTPAGDSVLRFRHICRHFDRVVAIDRRLCSTDESARAALLEELSTFSKADVETPPQNGTIVQNEILRFTSPRTPGLSFDKSDLSHKKNNNALARKQKVAISQVSDLPWKPCAALRL